MYLVPLPPYEGKTTYKKWHWILKIHVESVHDEKKIFSVKLASLITTTKKCEQIPQMCQQFCSNFAIPGSRLWKFESLFQSKESNWFRSKISMESSAVSLNRDNHLIPIWRIKGIVSILVHLKVVYLEPRHSEAIHFTREANANIAHLSLTVGNWWNLRF